MTQLISPANGNLYAYAADDPVNNIDPTGQLSCSSAVYTSGAAALLGGTAEVGIHTTMLALGEAALAETIAGLTIGTLLSIVTGGIGAVVARVVIGSVLLAC
jgi:hypothetical protein